MKTIELTGRALDYAVALAEGGTGLWYDTVTTWWIKINGKDRALSGGWASQSFTPTSGADGDDIIDREGISVIRCDDDYGVDRQGFTTSKRIPVWAASFGQNSAGDIYGPQTDHWGAAYSLDVADVTYGATRREAAMRAWVHHKLGWEVEIPEALLS